MQSHPFSEVFPEIDILALRDAEIIGVTLDKAGRNIEVTFPADQFSAWIENELREKLRDYYSLQSVDILYSEPEIIPAKSDTVILEKVKPEKAKPEAAKPDDIKSSGTKSEGIKQAGAKPAAGKSPADTQENLLGKASINSPVPIADLDLSSDRVVIRGKIFGTAHKQTRKGAYIVSFDIFDGSGSIRVSKYMDTAQNDDKKAKRFSDTDPKYLTQKLAEGRYVQVSGKTMLSRYENNEMIFDPTAIALIKAPVSRRDKAPEKRVELHLHTKMSALDGLTDIGAAINRAIEWEHPAVAITDHGVVHAFPEAFHAADGKIKILYGMEGYYFNDYDTRPAVFGDIKELPSELVVFDIETTGLNSFSDGITEIGAVVIKNGEITEEFHTYSNPGKIITSEITELTGITEETIRDAPDNTQSVRAFLDFAKGRVLCAHNASFDIGFIYEICFNAGIEFIPRAFDTLALARAFLPELSDHKLPTVASALKAGEFSHHRAGDDTRVTAFIAARFLEYLAEQNLTSSEDINAFACRESKPRREKTKHIMIFAKNEAGKKNLYKIISKSFLENFNRNPIVPKSLIMKHREGLIIGAACEAGEVFYSVERSSRFDQHRLARFYDYLEIMPIANNMFMLRGDNPRAADIEQLKAFNLRISDLGRELNIPVCATCDVHFLDPEDEIYRRVLLTSAKGFEDSLNDLPLFFRTTDEMLDEFSYLGTERAYETVVTNTRRIADMIEDISPLPPAKKLFSPKIEGSRETLKTAVYDKLRLLYGENPPAMVAERVETELNDILSRGYDVIYIAAQKLVRDSMDHGYLVGSRGSVGSSIVAYFAGITEVNALPPHYLCPVCKHADFESGAGYGCGADMPDKSCSVCGAAYNKEGFDIPFETFLGVNGNKVPDIDLNFSGEYQANAHRFTLDLFGESQVYRAGTILCVKEKTAFGYVKKYLETAGISVSRIEENRLAQGLVGVRRTTGQHPGGLVIVPRDCEVEDFSPVQHPAEDNESNVVTLHFEYHSLEDNILKLDELGHDVPTMIKMLEDYSGVKAEDIPLGDSEVLRAFRDVTALGIEADEIVGKTGSTGIPEFGTGFTKQVLCDTNPDKLDTLVRLSGYTHGTDVWLGNTRDIIINNIADISETIGCRDDIMLQLMARGIDMQTSFKIMESVRKGKGLPEGTEDTMHSHGVPDWYIDSCKKMKYLFPKAHAVAYVMMGFRVAWYKLNRPLAFYATYFYIRSQAGSFDASLMLKGGSEAQRQYRKLTMAADKSAKDDDLVTTLEACHEFYKRGFTFTKIDIYKSDPTRFIIKDEKTLIPPLISVAGLGETAANDIANTRKDGLFVSVDDFAAKCRKVSNAHIEALRKLGALDFLPETAQITLF